MPPTKLKPAISLGSNRIAAECRKAFRRVTLSPVLTRLYDSISAQQSLGDRGEREAERFFLRGGWVTIDRGYSDKFGEIDLIMIDFETLVFVEVKTRTTDYGGDPTEAVDKEKIKRITLTSQGFIRRFCLQECRIRYDVIAINWPDHDLPPQLKHYPAAFEPAGEFQMF
jgi:putative endonuclease